MKRFSLFAAVVGLALSAAACSDTATQPATVAPEAAPAPLFASAGTSFRDGCYARVSPSSLCLSASFRQALCDVIEAAQDDGASFRFGWTTYVVRAVAGERNGVAGLIFSIYRVSTSGERFVTSFFVSNADLGRLECAALSS